jgi:hypothetical protein
MKCRLNEQYKGSIKVLVLWKDKQYWQILGQTNQKKREKRLKLIKLEAKKGILAQTPLKSRGLLGNVLKNLYSNKLESLGKKWIHTELTKIEPRAYKQHKHIIYQQ